MVCCIKQSMEFFKQIIVLSWFKTQSIYLFLTTTKNVRKGLSDLADVDYQGGLGVLLSTPHYSQLAIL